MKIYLENTKSSAAKFWEVTVKGDQMTVRYGKVGSKGRTKVSELNSPESAIKYAKSQAKAKIRKGYEDPVEVAANKVIDSAFTLMPSKEAIEKYDLKKYINGYANYPNIRIYEGDTQLNELKLDAEDIGEIDGIVVDGHLTIVNNLEGWDAGAFLFVTGNVKVKNAILGDPEVWVKGNMEAENGIFMHYNHGMLTVEGNVSAYAVISDDHHFEYGGKISGITISAGSFDADFDDFETIFLDSVLDPEGRLDWAKLGKRLINGQTYLKKGVKPDYVIVQEQLDKILKKTNIEAITELDFSDKKLKAFPKKILELTNLRKLNISRNDIKELPENIGLLKNLEELNIERCGLYKLPESIGELSNLKVLYISNNFSRKDGDTTLQLPESIGNLQHLESIHINYVQGFYWPKSMAKLKNLKRLGAYNCSDEKPCDFPMVITALTGLEILEIGSNSFRTIPTELNNLTKLQELILNRSLCYLKEIPDLSGLINLKKLSANGNTSYTTRPQPKQSIIKQLFSITSLEYLGIDRHGRSKETLKNAVLERMLSMIEDDPERINQIKTALVADKKENPFYGKIWRGNLREPLQAEHLKGIGKLQHLKEIDLSFCDITSLPKDFYTLSNLKTINLGYSKELTTKTIENLLEKFPNTKIIFGDLKNAPKQSDDNPNSKLNELGKEGTKLLSAKKWDEAIPHFQKIIAQAKKDKIYTEYDYLYAHYGLIYSYSWAAFKSTDEKKKKEYVEGVLSSGPEALALCPEMVWHFTPMGKFQKEVMRIAGNALGWFLQESFEEKEAHEKALEYIERAVDSIDGTIHHYIYDTKVRILLKMGRKEEAYSIVYRVLEENPSFGDFKDIIKKAAYKKWVVANT